MTNLLKNKMSSKILIVALLTIALVGGVFIPTEPAAAAISGGTVAGNAAADLVVNTSGADYNVTFDTDIAATADSLWVIFPVGYTITDGDLTTAAVSDGTIASRILVNGVSRAVNNVTGDAANRKITIVLNAAIDLGTGTGTSFRILTGIQNRTTAGNTGTFTIDSNATAEVEQANVAAVTLTSGPVHHLKVTAASATPTAGADDELTVTAYDQWDNVCSAGANAYTGAKDLTFSGLAAAPDTTVPTVEVVAFGTPISVNFTAGASDATVATLKAYKDETASIDVTDGTYNSTGDAAYDVDINVAPGAATTLYFTTEPSATVVSGVAITQQPVVTAKDDYDNVDVNFTETITITEGSAGSLTNDTEAAVAGVADFSTGADLIYSNLADGESFTLTANDQDGVATDLTPVVSGVSVASNVVATKLVFATQPTAAVTSGTAFAQQPIIEAQDANNVKDTDFVGDVTLTDNAAGALGGTLVKTAIAGVADFTGLGVLYTNSAVDHESFNLLANDGSLTQATSDAVNPNIVATAIAVQTQPGVIVSGVSMTQPVIKFVLGSITDTDVTDTVTISEGGAGSLAGTPAVAAVAGVVTYTDLVYSAAADDEAVTFTFIDDVGAVDLSASPINSNALVADVLATKLVWTVTPSTCTSGAVCSNQGTIQAQNAQNFLDNDYVTAVTISENEAGGLVGTANQGAMTAGELTTTGIGYTATADAQNFTLTAASGAITSATTANIASNVVATQLVIQSAPSSIVSGVSMTQPVIRYADAAGVTDADVTDTITISEGGAGSLAGTPAVAAVAGVVTYTDLVYSAAADDEAVTLTFTDDVAGINLSASPVTSAQTADVLATKLVWTVTPSTCTSGAACSNQGTIQAQNAQNFLDNDYITAVTISENEAGSLVGTANQGAMTAGELTTTGIGYTATADAQNFTLTAASGAITSATTANIASNVVATKFIVTLSTNTPTAGVADTVTLRATNAGNITDVDYDPTGLTFTFVDSVAANLSTHTSPGSNSPTIPNSATVIAAFASGEASLATFTLVEAESLGTITVSDATLSGTSASVTVKHAAASTFTVTPSSTTPDTNTTLNAIVTAKDTYGNTADGANGATAFTGIVFLTTNATSPVWYNQVANITSGGTKTFSSAVKFQTVENNVTITAENNGATVTGTSATITVSSPSAPTVTAQTPVNGATSQAITVSPTVTFSEAMDATTVNTNTVQIRALTGDAIVNSVVTYNVSTFVATIDPVASLSNSTSYYVWISGAKNSAGTTVTAYTTGADQDFGTVALADGTLAVTGISSVETYAAVAGGWPDGDSATADGWSWTFSVTVPTTETSFAMRFANWTSGSNTIATANNIRFYSAQASANADADNTRLITVAATDSTAITLTSDLDATTAGRQIQVTVQAQVPTGSAAGSYSTSYGITSVAP